MAEARTSRKFFTRELKRLGVSHCSVYARFLNDNGDYDDHAFCVKRHHGRGWVLLDSAKDAPRYTKPEEAGQKRFKQLKTFRPIVGATVYTLE